MKYSAPKMVNRLNATNVIQSIKELGSPSDGDPNFRTVAAYQSDE